MDMLHCTTLPYRYIVHVWYGLHVSIPGVSGFCWPLTHDSIDPSDSQLQPGVQDIKLPDLLSTRRISVQRVRGCDLRVSPQRERGML